jgi:Carboxypeptidase regulatory-like domain
MKIATPWILSLVLLAGTGASLAQSTNSGDIRGSATDQGGAYLPGVTVSVLDVDTGVSKDFVTNQDGFYDTSSILTGSYKITFVKQGFETFVRGPITLEVGAITVNAKMHVGSTTEQVVVSSDVPLLTTETGEESVVLSNQTMDQLPQVGPDWENFMALLPGATNTLSSGVGSISINGNLPYSNVLQNGVSQTLGASQNATVANYENVAEIQISTSSFSAQYGIGEPSSTRSPRAAPTISTAPATITSKTTR